MGVLKNLWNRIENAYSTADNAPKQPGMNVPVDPREEKAHATENVNLHREPRNAPHRPYQP